MFVIQARQTTLHNLLICIFDRFYLWYIWYVCLYIMSSIVPETRSLIFVYKWWYLILQLWKSYWLRLLLQCQCHMRTNKYFKALVLLSFVSPIAKSALACKEHAGTNIYNVVAISYRLLCLHRPLSSVFSSSNKSLV